MTYEKVSDLKATLEECFATDIDLLNRWHIEAPAPLVTCVEKTYSDLMACENIDFYKIFDLSKLIGYFCREKDGYGNLYLTGFFLKPDYRNEECKKQFFNIVREVMGGKEYLAGLYEKNVRGCKFLERHGRFFFKGVDDKGNNWVSYKLN